jgi:hypothetical protein
MATPQSPSPKTGSSRKPHASFHEAVQDAVSAGVAPEAMTLRLTHRDAAMLRRDPKVPVEAISFVDGEMRLLGVKVVTGGVAVSGLDVVA